MRDLDDLSDDMRHAMRLIRKAISGVPAEEQGFKGAHDRFTRDVAVLLMALEDTSRYIDANQ
jgi:hypothetical protein